MKQIHLFILLLFNVCVATAQEIIVENDTYVSYQDSLFILREFEVTNTGLDGLNDTIVRYVPPALDTAGLIDLLFTRSVNDLNTRTAQMATAFRFRAGLSSATSYDNLLNDLGADRDSMIVALYGSRLKGRYRILTDTTNFLVDIIDHPTNPAFLRAVGTQGEGIWNIRVWGAWYMQLINFSGASQFVIWDRVTTEPRVFRSPTFALPSVVAPPNLIRLIKIQ